MESDIEMSNELLKNYLDNENYSQDLINKQSKITH